MKVTVTPAGEVVVDTDSPAQAAAFVRELHRGKKPTRKKKPKPLEIESIEEPLSQELVDTWNWLVANNTDEGVTAADCAEGLDIKPLTARYRLHQLVTKELAHQPGRGRFRPGEA